MTGSKRSSYKRRQVGLTFEENDEPGCYRNCLENEWMRRIFRHDSDFLVWPAAVMFLAHCLQLRC